MKWTGEEKKILMFSGGMYSLDELMLLVKHPKCSIMDMIRKLRSEGHDIKTKGSLGLGREEWTAEDIRQLSELAPTKDIAELCEAFPAHSEQAIACKLSRIGVTRKYLPTHRAAGEKSPLWSGTGEVSGQRKATIRLNAKRRNILLDDSDAFWKHSWDKYVQQDRRCIFTALPISFGDGTVSIDRIDSTRGYVIGNIQWCHKCCNWAKRNSTDGNYVGQCAAVVAICRDKLPAECRALLKSVL